MAEFLLFKRAGLLNFTLTFITSIFLVTAGWGQSVTTDKLDYAPGEIAIISGSGWTGDSMIDIHMDEDPPLHEDHEHDFDDVPVNADGTWSVEFPIEEYHLGVTFYVTVTGQQTGMTAEHVFTDNGFFAITINPISSEASEIQKYIITIKNSENNSGNSVKFGSFQILLPGGYANPTAIENFKINNNSTTRFTTYNGGSYSNGYNSINRYIGITSIGNTSNNDNRLVKGEVLTFEVTTVNPGAGDYTWTTGASNNLFSSFNNNGSIEGNQPVVKIISSCNAPTINENPENQTITYGENISFSVDAEGDGLEYQWQVDTGDGFENVNNGGFYSGAESATLNIISPTVAMHEFKYRVVVSGDCDADAVSEAAVLTVTPKALEVIASSDSKEYGSEYTFDGTEFTTEGLVNDDAVTSATITSTGSGATAAVANYDINISAAQGTGLGNYTITYTKGNLEVTPKALEVIANSDSKEYGSEYTFDGTEFTTEGLVNDDAVTSATITSAGSGATAVVDNYDIDISAAVGTGLGNYTITYTEGNLEVTPKALEVIANSDSKEYGSEYTFDGTEFTTEGLVNDDAVTSATITSTGSAATAAVANYDINISAAQGIGLGNYTITYTKGNLEVTPKALEVIANSDSKEYGSEYTFDGTEFTTEGLVNDDAVTSATITSAGSGATAVVDNYDIDISAAVGTGLGNYAITYAKGNLEVTPKSLEVIANSDSKVYGSEYTFDGTEFTTEGLVNDDAVTSATITSTGSAATAAVANYDINISAAQGIGLGNYTITYTEGNLEVTKKGLEVTAVADDITYGDAAPTVTVEYSGFVNNDDADDLDNTGFALGTDYTQFDAVGTYNTTITITTAEDNNYNFTPLTSSTFTVGQKELTITANDLSKYCGQTIIFGGTEFSQIGLVGGDVIESATISSNGAGASAEPAGSPYVIIIEDAIGTGLSNYTITYETGELTVNPVSLDLTNAQNPRSINEDVIIKIGVSDGATQVSGALVTLKVEGKGSFEATSSNGIATFNLGKLPAELYAVTVQAGGCETSAEVYLPIYDPNGGFVTGGGWIDSPAGAMTGDYETAAGKANFGFNAKYKNGKNNTTEVDGSTNFQFKDGDFHFKSSKHEDESLIISGAKATFRGVGTVNGKGNHQFRIIAIDGDVSGGGGTDKFRIMVWDDNSSSTLIYDNKRGIAESSDDATVLGGGSIVIHKPKGGNNKTAEVNEKITVAESKEEIVQLDILGNLAVAPNPVRHEAKVRFSLIEDAGVTVRLYDFNGREIQTLYTGNAKAHQVYEAAFQRNNSMSGIYIVKLTTDRGHSYNKQVIFE
ncbi:hypothetical protein DHB64_13735 [Antarcticibacterium sp. W02-3]|uniref:MBG domain-containing protein n=1 Tax=Antarcticibacterium sp. W02-3 TaxID=2183747 RepID=UPI002042FA61|nr:MBG domain-containing protein [Antarcticibacterium sp. W02-3]MCM4160957.1 hypothetical protein [Antarcticibacterium sp. W02-3]